MPVPDPLTYRIDTRGQMQPHLSQEWLLTNGLGGFASSTVVGCNTRRYHGLLVAATLPPVGRVMAVNRVGEILRFVRQIADASAAVLVVMVLFFNLAARAFGRLVQRGRPAHD